MWGVPGKQRPIGEHNPLSLLEACHTTPLRKLNDPVRSSAAACGGIVYATLPHTGLHASHGKDERMTIRNFGTQQPTIPSRVTTRLRQMLQSGTMVAAPFVLNAFHAQIAASLGFQAVYMTGFGTAAERGYPDVGLVTQTEMVQNARYIASAVAVPVLCDADTGYGNAINVTRTVREYEAAGLARLSL